MAQTSKFNSVDAQVGKGAPPVQPGGSPAGWRASLARIAEGGCLHVNVEG